MKRLSAAVAAAMLLVLLVFAPIAATTVSVPNVFFNGESPDASLFNNDFGAITSWANGNVDNTNIGTAGIFPSQIKCTTIPQCTFVAALQFSMTPTFPSGISYSLPSYCSSGLTNVGTANSAGGGGVNPNVFGVSCSGAGVYQLAIDTGFDLGLQGYVRSGGGFYVGSTSVTASAIVSNGNVVSNNGVFVAPSGIPIQICPNGSCGYSLTITTAGGVQTSGPIIANGDVYASRSGNTGALFLGSSGAHYLFFDGSNYQMSAGGLYVNGVYVNSKRSLKEHIAPLSSRTALAWLRSTEWAAYAYKSEHAARATHVGLIADAAPTAFAGTKHDHDDVAAVAAADATVIVAQQAEIDALERRVARIEHR